MSAATRRKLSLARKGHKHPHKGSHHHRHRTSHTHRHKVVHVVHKRRTPGRGAHHGLGLPHRLQLHMVTRKRLRKVKFVRRPRHHKLRMIRRARPVPRSKG